jgi:hypothetical protein
MTDIMIDLTSRPRKRYETLRCYYCNSDKYPNGKVIDPTTDKTAHKTSRGDWKCGQCLIEDMYKMNKLLNRDDKAMGCTG